jgi:uncharacterized Zn-finger protein
MNPCKEIIEGALSRQRSSKMDCPIKIHPKCHPRVHLDVFVDGDKKLVTLVCSKCDRTISTIRIK